MTLSDTLGASVTLDGQARVLPGGIRGTAASSESYTDFTVESDDLMLAVDGTHAVNISGRGGRSVGDVELTVSSFVRTTSDGLDETVSAFRSRRTVNVAGGQDPTRTASAEISFSASSPETNMGPDGLTPLSVDIDLAYDGTGDPAAGRVDQWDSGMITVEAADGSRVRAEPIANDPTTLRIVVGDVVLERPWSEGYQVACVGQLSGCR